MKTLKMLGTCLVFVSLTITVMLGVVIGWEISNAPVVERKYFQRVGYHYELVTEQYKDYGECYVLMEMARVSNELLERVEAR